jgi:hypothetical protein
MGKILYPSYFTSCISEEIPEEFDLDGYVSGTLRQTMALVWKVRYWEARTSGTLYYGDGYTRTYSGDYQTLQRTPFSPPVAETEEDLVCTAGTLLNSRFTSNVAWTVEGITSNVTDNIGWYVELQGGVSTNNKIYFPCIIGNIWFVNANYPFFNECGSYTISFENYTLTGILYSGDYNGSGNVLVEIRAQEYWSYGGTYNTSTGARL